MTTIFLTVIFIISCVAFYSVIAGIVYGLRYKTGWAKLAVCEDAELAIALTWPFWLVMGPVIFLAYVVAYPFYRMAKLIADTLERS